MTDFEFEKVRDICNKLSCFYPNILDDTMEFLNLNKSESMILGDFDTAIACINAIISNQVNKMAYE
jgi:hypothetical protein